MSYESEPTTLEVPEELMKEFEKNNRTAGTRVVSIRVPKDYLKPLPHVRGIIKHCFNEMMEMFWSMYSDLEKEAQESLAKKYPFGYILAKGISRKD